MSAPIACTTLAAVCMFTHYRIGEQPINDWIGIRIRKMKRRRRKRKEKEKDEEGEEKKNEEERADKAEHAISSPVAFPNASDHSTCAQRIR